MDAGNPFLTKQEASHNDELYMQQRSHFSETLKDLKNLRKQLYSAAEYFEETYNKEEQKYMVVEALRDYITKALVNTVDHLGFTAYKTSVFLDEQITEVCKTTLRTSCIEQRQQTCERLIDAEGLLKQSFSVKHSQHHKRYVFPETGDDVHGTVFVNQDSNYYSEDDLSEHRSDKRAVSPNRLPLPPCASVLERSSSPHPSTSWRYPSAPPRSVSLSTHIELERKKCGRQHSGKNKRGFKSFLSMRKSRKDGSF